MIIEQAGKEYGRVEISAPTASAKRRGWWKWVTGVDRSKKFGWCLEGEFLRDGEHDLPIGTVLVRSTPIGSAKYSKNSHTIWIVAADGGLTALHDGRDELCTWQQIGPTMLDRCTAALRYCPAVLETLGEDRRRRVAAREAAEAENLEYRRVETAKHLAAEKANSIALGYDLFRRLVWPLAEDARAGEFADGLRAVDKFAYPGVSSPLAAAASAVQLYWGEDPTKKLTESTIAQARAALVEAMCILQPGSVASPPFSSQELALIVALRALPEDRLAAVLDEICASRNRPYCMTY